MLRRMPFPDQRVRLALVALVLLAAIAGLLAGANAAGAGARKPLITRHGVGEVVLGETASRLQARHLIGPVKHGCPLGGPQTRGATLSRPLRGAVDFTVKRPLRVQDIGISGGAVTARGIAVGSTMAQVRQAYPRAQVDHSTDRAFGTTLVRVPRSEGGPFELAVDVHRHHVALIGVPFIATCD